MNRAGIAIRAKYLPGEISHRCPRIFENSIPALSVETAVAEMEVAIKKRPAAFPTVFPVSSLESSGIAELRGAIARLLTERGASA